MRFNMVGQFSVKVFRLKNVSQRKLTRRVSLSIFDKGYLNEHHGQCCVF